MEFERTIWIKRPPVDVFVFLRDKDLFPQEEGSAVLALEKITPGPAAVGTRYREVVRMLPFYNGEILSELTRFKPPTYLEEDFSGAGMEGWIGYEFRAEDGGTRLIQREWLRYRGLLYLFEPLIARMLLKKIEERLVGIKQVLEGGLQVGEL